MPGTQTDGNIMPTDLEALDAALEDFAFEAEGEDTVVEEPMSEDDLAALDLALEREEVYGAQEATPLASEEEKSELTAQANSKTRKASKASSGTSAAKTPSTRVPRDLTSVASDMFVLTGDVSMMDNAALDAAKAATIALKPAQVKIAEKFENLFTTLSVGKEPSTYVMTAFRLLDKTKTMTSSDLVGAYKAIGLGEGTARSQSGQIMNLFDTVGIAKRTGGSLILLDNSVVADRIRKLSVISSPLTA